MVGPVPSRLHVATKLSRVMLSQQTRAKLLLLVLKQEDLDWENKVLVGKDWTEDAYDVGRSHRRVSRIAR